MGENMIPQAQVLKIRGLQKGRETEKNNFIGE